MRRISLKTKFIFYIILLILFISLSFLLLFINWSNSLIRDNLTDIGFHLTRNLSYSAELGVTSEDPVLLQSYLEGIFTEEDVILAAVYNKKGEIIVSRKKVEIREEVPIDIREVLLREKGGLKRISYTERGEKFYDFYSPIFVSGLLAPKSETRKLAGFARVGLSLKKIEAQTRKILIPDLFITVLVVLLGIFMSFFLAGRLTRPIKELIKGAEILGKGNLDYQIKINTGDEVGELAKSFNQMAEDLKRSYTALEESKTILEIKVKARTRELEELAQNLDEKVKERTGELEGRTKELEELRTALLNILEEVDLARSEAERERDKTLSIINNFADGLLIFDAENKVSLINPLAQDFLKIRQEDIAQNSILELAKLPNFQPLVNVLGKDPREIFRKELSLPENLAIELSTIPIIRENKKIGTLVILHNVTREKMIERMKTEFVSLSAHQLRTPLAAIKWTLRMILDGDLGLITEEQRTFLEKTYQSNERMINLINDLLNVSRIEEGRYLYKPVPVNLEEIVQSLLNSHKEETKRKKLHLEFKKPEKELPKIMLDVEKMELAIENLLNNAISYTPSGGQIIISLKEAEKGIEFSIQDTGIGISKEQQGRVFTKFFRGTNAIKADTEGTGLGLFITKNIIEAHGGKIWFKTKEGVGTTLHFTLPIRS